VSGYQPSGEGQMSVMTVTTRITRQYLERKTKSDLAQMYLDLLNSGIKVADEVNQCLQIIVTNAGLIKDDRSGPTLESCIAIESAVERAKKATWSVLRED